jgi:hypothetical protein
MDIVPEIAPDIQALKEVLTRELPAGCKVKIPPLNRKCLRVAKSFFVATDVLVRKNKIIVTNPVPMLMGVYIVICLPLAIYAMFKLKENEALRSTVQDILFRATRSNTVASGEA